MINNMYTRENVQFHGWLLWLLRKEKPDLLYNMILQLDVGFGHAESMK